MEKFEQEENVHVDNQVALVNPVKSCSRENLDLALQDPSTLTIVNKYVEFEDKVRAGHLGKTPTFCFGFIEHTRLILVQIYSVKTNNLKLFHKCSGEIG